MLSKNAAKIVAVMIVLAALFCTAWVKDGDAQKRTWEYKHLDFSSSAESQYEKAMDQQGAEGWELVAEDREQPGGRIHFYFKRAK